MAEGKSNLTHLRNWWKPETRDCYRLQVFFSPSLWKKTI